MISVDHAALMRCPLCQANLSLQENQLVCLSGHSFDIAKQGYVNLLPVQHKKSLSPGDSKAMVKARKEFLDSGYYQPIAEKLVNLLQLHLAMTECLRLLDAGCGEGFYLDNVLASGFHNKSVKALGLDISKDAVLAASKRNKQAGWVVGTNAKLPFKENAFDGLLCLFGFPCYAEFKRVMESDGILIIVDAGENHLLELREVIYPDVKISTPPKHADLETLGVSLVAEESLCYPLKLDSQEMIHNLLAMTPHLYKAPLEGKKAAEALQEIKVTVDVVFRVYRF